MRINSMTPSSSSHHIGMLNGCNGDNNSEHNHTLERNDGRNSSISSSHSPHRTLTTNSSYNNGIICENQNTKSHHHSLDRESNNKCYREIGQRQFYNTNPKPQAYSKQQKQQQLQQQEQRQQQQKFHQSNNLASRQSMPMKTVAKSNLSNTTISKSDANMAINSSDECLNFDRMSIHSQCNSDIYKNRHMILASSNSNKSSKQYCKYHNFN